MPQFKITVQEIDPLRNVSAREMTATEASGNFVATPNAIEIYTQTVSELNLKRLIDAMNPSTRKRKVKKEGV